MSSATPESSDSAAVEAIVRDYIEGWYNGNVERMDRALHTDLVKRILGSDVPPGESELRAVTKERMVEMTAAGGGASPAAEYEITVDDVSGDIATARVTSQDYLDYLHLSRTSDGWKIANVLFRVHGD